MHINVWKKNVCSIFPSQLVPNKIFVSIYRLPDSQIALYLYESQGIIAKGHR